MRALKIATPLVLLASAVCAFDASNAEVQAFIKADGNKDGVLTRAEFKVFVQGMAQAGQPTAKKIKFFNAYGYAFGVVDKNGDGLASPQEMRSADNSFQAEGG